MLFLLTDLIVLGAINAIMVTGLNLQYGYAGLLNFAYFAYIALGAYVAAVTTMGPSPGPPITYVAGQTLPWYVGLLLGTLAAGTLGGVVFLFTIRRLRSDYLAIVTVAVAFILWNLVNNAQYLFNGASGLFNVPQITGNFAISTEASSLIYAALSVVLLAGCVWISRMIFLSPFGRLLRATREDEVVAKAFGRTVWRPQLYIVVIGTAFGGLAGGLLVFYITAWSPASWLPLETFFLMAALIIGGSGNYWGALLGAFAVIEGLSEISRYVPSLGRDELVGSFRQILIGVGMILILRFRPEGLVPERWLNWYVRRRRRAAGVHGSPSGGQS